MNENFKKVISSLLVILACLAFLGMTIRIVQISLETDNFVPQLNEEGLPVKNDQGEIVMIPGPVPEVSPELLWILQAMAVALAVNFGAVMAISFTKVEAPPPRDLNVNPLLRRFVNPQAAPSPSRALRSVDLLARAGDEILVRTETFLNKALKVAKRSVQGLFSLESKHWAVLIYLLYLLIGTGAYLAEGGLVESNPGTILPHLQDITLTSAGVLVAVLTSLNGSES